MVQHTTLNSLFPDQRADLGRFRRAAADLYRALGEKIGASLRIGRAGIALLSEQELRAAAAAIRLTLLPNEPANFEKTIDRLRLLQDPQITRRITKIKRDWERVEEGQIAFYDADEPLRGKDIRDAWLYGQLTHQRTDSEQNIERLEQEGDVAVFALQVALMGHARLIMRLDAVVADVLGESRVWERPDALKERFFAR
jgi:hypothetical protein